jgi:hypothetical protein
MTNVKLPPELAQWAEDLPEITALIKELEKEIANDLKVTKTTTSNEGED